MPTLRLLATSLMEWVRHHYARRAVSLTGTGSIKSSTSAKKNAWPAARRPIIRHGTGIDQISIQESRQVEFDSLEEIQIVYLETAVNLGRQRCDYF